MNWIFIIIIKNASFAIIDSITTELGPEINASQFKIQ